MKKIFYIFLFSLLSIASRAQLVIYSENFDGFTGYSIVGWTSTYSGLVPWQSGLPGLFGGCLLPVGGPMSYTLGTNKVAAIADCGAMFDQNNVNVFSYTPHISLTGISGAWLKFDSYFNKHNDGVDTEKATVEISTDLGVTWTILKDVPASAPFGNFTTYYIDLSAYNNASDIRIGFRYSDGGGWLQGWAIDNVQVFVPAHKDLVMLSVTPLEPLQSYIPVGSGFTHHATIYNAGLDTIHSFAIDYQQGSGPVKRDSISGVTLLPVTVNEFTDNIPDSVFSVGNFPVTMWVALDSDEYHYNDTGRTVIRAANFLPKKRLAIEGGEATWHSWSPRVMTYLNMIPALDVDACVAALHDTDPMTDSIYTDFVFNLSWNYVPYILFDRRVSVPLDSFFQYLDVQKRYFGYADIDLDGNLDGNTVTVNATIKPAINLDGDHRLALVITQDSVTGSGPGYDQANIYAGGTHGVMGGFELMPDPVPASQMYYNYVGRTISPNPEGVIACLPSHMLANGSYDCTLSTTIDPSWNARNLHAMVFLIKHDDSSVLNANRLPFALTTAGPSLSLAGSALYPNPANESTNLAFTLTHEDVVNISITDLSGRTLYKYPASTFAAGKNKVLLPLERLTDGIYLVNLFSSESHKSYKLEVLH